MKKTIFTLACLTLWEVPAYSLTLRNNTGLEKSVVISFSEGEEFKANVEKEIVANVNPEQEVASVKWYRKFILLCSSNLMPN